MIDVGDHLKSRLILCFENWVHEWSQIYFVERDRHLALDLPRGSSAPLEALEKDEQYLWTLHDGDLFGCVAGFVALWALPTLNLLWSKPFPEVIVDAVVSANSLTSGRWQSTSDSPQFPATDRRMSRSCAFFGRSLGRRSM